MIEHGIFEQLLHRDVNDDGNYRNQLVDVSSDSLLLQAVALIDHFLVEEGFTSSDASASVASAASV